MAKLSLTDIANLESETTVVAALNSNNDAVEAAFSNTLSRDGTSPNQMNANIDINGYKILNVPAPVEPTDIVRLQDILDGIEAIDITGITAPALSGNAGKYLTNDGTSTVFWITPTGLQAANNLSDVVSVSTSRTNLGLGSSATINTGTSGNTIPLLSTNNTWSDAQTFSAGVTLNGGATVSVGEFRLSSTPTSLHSDSAGFRGAPQNLQSTNYAFLINDAGSGVTNTGSSAVTWTIQSFANCPYPIHTTIVLDNQGSGAVTINRQSGVSLRSNGSGTSANKTLSQYQVATLYNVATDVWTIIGV